MSALRDRGIVIPGSEAGSNQYRMPPSVCANRECVYRLQLDALGLAQDDLFALQLKEVAAAYYG
ncbi:MAG: hypothetical protein KGN33_14455 [Paracoccaceae bacterium]|nr:hypothetical protein [Paracoccaceae bacterium]